MDILMPQLGETVTEGKITAWFKSIGESVGPGDNLFEIETDKVSMEVPATAAGVLTEIRVAAGEAAPVGAVVAVLGGMATAGATVAAPNFHQPAPSPSPRPSSARGKEAAHDAAVTPPGKAGPISSGGSLPSPSPPAGEGRGGGSRGVAAFALPATSPRHDPERVTQIEGEPRITLDPFREVRAPERNYGPARLASGVVTTPLARRLAGEAGIDLARIEPGDHHGRITGRDVEATINNVRALYDAFGRRRPQRQLPPPDPDSIRVLYQPGSYEEIPLDDTQRASAMRLVEAASIPQFRLTADIAVERLEQVREEANASALPDQAGKAAFRLALDDFIVRALALALARVPAADAVWAEDRILRFKRSDIAIAVATGGGLAFPVIRGAERKPLLDISAERLDLAGRARAGKLSAADLQGGASAVCTLTAPGVRAFDLMVMPPHASMLAVGTPARRPIETADGGFRFATQMTVTLACDQRVLDAALAAELIGALRDFLEHPVGLMI
jgi:pyruvate dehydrogenase E2 component (dihydrolipoamide acetyltransferase)